MIVNKLEFLKEYSKIYIISNEFDENKIKFSKSNFYIFLNKKKQENFKNKYQTSNTLIFSFSNFKRGYLHEWKLSKKNYFISKKYFNIKISKKLKKNLLFIFYVKLFKSKMVFFGIKKKFIEESFNLRKIFYIKKIINKFNKFEIKLKITNSEKKLFNLLELENNLYIDKIRINIASFFNHENFKYLLSYLFLPIRYLISIRKVNLKKFFFKVALRNYNGGLPFKSENQSLGIFSKVYKNDLLYVFDTLNSNFKFIQNENKKYDFLYSKYTGCRNVKISTIFLYLLTTIINLFSIIFLIGKPRFLIIEFLKLQSNFLLWSNFVNLYKVNFFLSYNDQSSEHIYRNLILKKHNILTSKLKHTNSENIFHYNSNKYYLKTNELYNLFDHEFHWSKQSINMSKQNKSLSKIKYVTGPLWMNRDINFENNNKKILNIGMFNSSFNDVNSVNPISSHVIFLELAYKILNLDNTKKIFFKPKKDIIEYQKNKKTRIILKKLKNFKNFIILNPEFNNIDIYKKADLSICMPFTSTHIESLYLNKKFIFYDGINKYDQSLFKDFQSIYYSKANKVLNFINQEIQENYFKDYSMLKKITFEDDNKNSLEKIVNILNK